MDTLFRIESVCSTISSFPEKSRPPGSLASSLLDDDKETDPQSPEGFVEFFLWLRFLLWIRFHFKVVNVASLSLQLCRSLIDPNPYRSLDGFPHTKS